MAAFMAGIASIHFIFEPTTLEEISADPGHFEGRLVEFETYAQTGPDPEIWLGQPFEKREVSAIAESDSDLEFLRKVLAQNATKHEYNRIKVVARGVIHDNCAHRTCCFSQSVILSNAEIIPVDSVERYRLPFP